MKKRYAFLSLFLIMTLQACAEEKPVEAETAKVENAVVVSDANQWVEGEHYKVLNEEVAETSDVTEFFSFWCPHCFNFEPIAEKIKQQLESTVRFNKVHVNFMRFTGPETQNAATQAMLVGRLLNKEDELNQAIFSYIHLQQQPINGLAELKTIFQAKGVEPAEFDKLIASDELASLFEQNSQTITTFGQHISGVPNIIVNGKYQATFTSDMNRDDMVELVVWLSKQS
ncbi:thiol:disulfide interchange protein DsbA/DsbL [Aliiglaciecola sp. LCG003]|uniref:thiol:disulfide interchange protein DsbA/DsbL n=1 Tax=Aliiglaciecola sp. LCG003 TaxID=3053655 RepID=UPI002572EFB7|nr:thiol:disulfide interchange protein DsbA/DsbL [Aliiglaciecola sp. LCG003]WJG08800.1 thiol:disulfide interchange protein DsbA/DsbL [Aliiglaciecola sp. LCG003]